MEKLSKEISMLFTILTNMNEFYFTLPFMNHLRWKSNNKNGASGGTQSSNYLKIMAYNKKGRGKKNNFTIMSNTKCHILQYIGTTT